MPLIELDFSYSLSLFFSYLLPLYEVRSLPNGVVEVEKVSGFAQGLKCRSEVLRSTCIIPRDHSLSDVRPLLGIETRKHVEEFFGLLKRFGFNFELLSRFSLIYSPRDKQYIIVAVLLSQNTDYYSNTVRWVKALINNGIEALKLERSYQVERFVDVYEEILKIVNAGLDIGNEVVELLKIEGVSAKSISAHLLHAYGILSEAPVDRHFRELLEAAGLKFRQPDKNCCIKSGFQHQLCQLRGRCVYGVVSSIFGSFSGVVQSAAYICGRILRGKVSSRTKETLLRSIPLDKLEEECSLFRIGVAKFIEAELAK